MVSLYRLTVPEPGLFTHGFSVFVRIQTGMVRTLSVWGGLWLVFSSVPDNLFSGTSCKFHTLKRF